MIAYVVEPPRYDLTPLYEKYNVKFILSGKQSLALREDPADLLERIKSWAFTEFVFAEDFLVLTGNMTVVTIAALAIQAACGDVPRMLRYDHDSKEYIEIFTTPTPSPRARHVG